VPHFHHRLEDLKQLLLGMGALVEHQLSRAARSLFEGDWAKAQHVTGTDADVDDLEVRVDDRCIQLLALYQPAAADLRFITAAMKVVTGLERIGDQAVNIARCTLGPPLPAQLLDSGLRRMAELAQNMVSESVRALARNDAALARRVIAGDAALDDLEQETVRALLAEAARAPELLHGAFRLAYAARSLERIGDHATNMAEMALYIAEGSLQRHAASMATRSPRPARIHAPLPLAR
jgi:phosphate transport system protein